MGSFNESNSKKSSTKSLNSQNNIGHLKSKFILKKIINLIKEKTFLEIIKYNKKAQNRLDIDINNYKNFSKKFSSIELELTIIKKDYNKFISIFEEENKKYYHIFLNDNEKEIMKYELDENDNLEKLKIIIDYQIKSFEGLFENCEYIESIYFKKFYRNIANIEYMFYGCSSLKELNVSNFNINNETKMNGMFYGCSSLTNINLSNFNTSNVTDMNDMFFGCASLKELNLSNFNTNKVTDMSGMFIGCSSLKELDLSNFNTNNVNNMYCMFFGCSSLIELNLSNFNTDNVTNISGMFTGCSDQLQKKIRTQYKNIKEGAFH